MRASLDWAFSSDGDAQIGVALTAAAVPLWVQSSLLEECRERAELALARLDDAAADAPRLRMQLSAALGWSLMYGVGRAREAGPAWTVTLQLAERLDDRDYLLRALWGLCIDQFNNGEFRKALELAHRFAAAVAGSSNTVDLMMADRLLATTLHYLGDQNLAHHHITRTLARLSDLTSKPQVVRFRFDLRVSAHYFQARILWLLGLADQSLRVVERNIEEGRASGHALTFCSVLGQGACPLTFLAGDLDAAERYCTMLVEHTERHPIRLWNLWARAFRGVVMARRGDVPAGLEILRKELEPAGDARFLPRFLLPLGELAAGLGAVGEVAQGLVTVDEALARCEARDERWYEAELLRIKGELLLHAGEQRSVAGRRAAFRPRDRGRAPAGRGVLGAANRRQPCALEDQPGSRRRCACHPRRGLRQAHRRICHSRHAQRAGDDRAAFAAVTSIGSRARGSARVSRPRPLSERAAPKCQQTRRGEGFEPPARTPHPSFFAEALSRPLHKGRGHDNWRRCDFAKRRRWTILRGPSGADFMSWRTMPLLSRRHMLEKAAGAAALIALPA